MLKIHCNLKKLLVAGFVLSATIIPFTSALLSTSAASTASSTAIAIKDYSGMASGLFNNMRTPAALIGGAIVPIGILSAPPIEQKDSAKMKVLKKMNLLLAVSSLLSEILAITYSTVAINKLAEVQFAPTAGVAELLSQYFELAWIGTNVHFLFGMFGFGLLVGTKSHFLYGGSVGKIASSLSLAAFLQCISIVNKGIAWGSGSSSPRFASNLFSLALRYTKLVFSSGRTCPFSVGAIICGMFSVFLAVKHFFEQIPKKKTD